MDASRRFGKALFAVAVVVVSVACDAGTGRSGGGPFVNVALAQEAPAFLQVGKSYKFVWNGGERSGTIREIDKKAGWIRVSAVYLQPGAPISFSWLNLAQIITIVAE
jgi:hypothetical protein